MQKYEQICYDVLQYLDHSPTGRVLESFAPARGDMHSPRATGRALSIHPAIYVIIGGVWGGGLCNTWISGLGSGTVLVLGTCT